MLAARDLTIVWGDTPRYWTWTSLPDSRSVAFYLLYLFQISLNILLQLTAKKRITNRFSEVAELVEVCWLEIRGKISTRILSPNTTYAAFLVFKSTAGTHGFEYLPAEVAMGISGCEHKTQTAYLDPVPTPDVACCGCI